MDVQLAEGLTGCSQGGGGGEQLLVEEGQVGLQPDVEPAVGLSLVIRSQGQGPDAGENQAPHISRESHLYEPAQQQQRQH